MFLIQQLPPDLTIMLCYTAFRAICIAHQVVLCKWNKGIPMGGQAPILNCVTQTRTNNLLQDFQCAKWSFRIVITTKTTNIALLDADSSVEYEVRVTIDVETSRVNIEAFEWSSAFAWTWKWSAHTGLAHAHTIDIVWYHSVWFER